MNQKQGELWVRPGRGKGGEEARIKQLDQSAIDPRDHAHQATARSLASGFHPHLRAVYPPDGLDPADLTEAHLRELLKST